MSDASQTAELIQRAKLQPASPILLTYAAPVRFRRQLPLVVAGVLCMMYGLIEIRAQEFGDRGIFIGLNYVCVDPFASVALTIYSFVVAITLIRNRVTACGHARWFAGLMMAHGAFVYMSEDTSGTTNTVFYAILPAIVLVLTNLPAVRRSDAARRAVM